MRKTKHLAVLITVIAVFSGCFLTSCKMPAGKKKHTVGGQQEETKPSEGAKQGDQGAQNLTGDWDLGFTFGKDAQGQDIAVHATMHLDQQGQQFKGTGTDTESGKSFSIDDGVLENGQVRFFKKYPDSPPVEYTGNFKPDPQGLYMEGEYQTGANGNIVSGAWQAQLKAPQQEGAKGGALEAARKPEEEPSLGGGPAWPSDRPPNISGKWTVGYEYNFRTMHSNMFLEEEGGKVTGRGVDLNTGEKFVIEKGWYAPPKVTLVKKYGGGKKGGGKVVTFKGEVQVVNEKDYQGPYMAGKTQGGGAWEAELVKDY